MGRTVLLYLLLTLGCSEPGESSAQVAKGGAGGGSGDTAGGTGGATGEGWAEVDALLDARATEAGVTDLGLVVFGSDDSRRYEHMLGSYTADSNVAVASASKMVSGLVLFDSIRRGELSLDATVGEVLGWTGDNRDITLEQLLSFTSGLAPNADCTAKPLVAFADCVGEIGAAAVDAAPGLRFDYGSTHLQVAARMAEVTSGKTWEVLFDETLRTPLGLSESVRYFTWPRQSTGTQNPLVAGGLRISLNEYAAVLALVFHRGNYQGLTVGTEELFDTQAREPFPEAVIGNSPMVDIGLSYHYGLTAWLLCDTPGSGCDRLSSPGAFGFTPWLDRAAGYYAILGMELAQDSLDAGVVAFAVNLQQELAPLIAERL